MLNPWKPLILIIGLAGCADRLQPKTWSTNTSGHWSNISEWYGFQDDHCGGIDYEKDLAPRSWCPGLADRENPKGMTCFTSESEAKMYVEKVCDK